MRRILKFFGISDYREGYRVGHEIGYDIGYDHGLEDGLNQKDGVYGIYDHVKRKKGEKK